MTGSYSIAKWELEVFCHQYVLFLFIYSCGWMSSWMTPLFRVSYSNNQGVDALVLEITHINTYTFTFSSFSYLQIFNMNNKAKKRSYIYSETNLTKLGCSMTLQSRLQNNKISLCCFSRCSYHLFWAAKIWDFPPPIDHYETRTKD